MFISQSSVNGFQCGRSEGHCWNRVEFVLSLHYQGRRASPITEEKLNNGKKVDDSHLQQLIKILIQLSVFCDVFKTVLFKFTEYNWNVPGLDMTRKVILGLCVKDTTRTWHLEWSSFLTYVICGIWSMLKSMNINISNQASIKHYPFYHNLFYSKPLDIALY